MELKRHWKTRIDINGDSWVELPLNELKQFIKTTAEIDWQNDKIAELERAVIQLRAAIMPIALMIVNDGSVFDDSLNYLVTMTVSKAVAKYIVEAMNLTEGY